MPKLHSSPVVSIGCIAESSIKNSRLILSFSFFFNPTNQRHNFETIGNAIAYPLRPISLTTSSCQTELLPAYRPPPPPFPSPANTGYRVSTAGRGVPAAQHSQAHKWLVITYSPRRIMKALELITRYCPCTGDRNANGERLLLARHI